MRIGVVADAGCDLPKSFIGDNKITILPIAIRVGELTLTDTRDPDATQAFYKNNLGERGQDAETAPLTVEQIRDLFLSKLVVDYDHVFCLTIASSRSPIYENAVKASFAILSGYKPIRQQAGISTPFVLRVVDTKNLFAGQGVVTAEAVRLIKAGENPSKIRERLEYIADNTYGYMLPRDLYYLRARAQTKGDRSVGWFSAALGTALDIKPLVRGYRNETGPVARLRGFEPGVEKLFAYTAERIRAGLLTPIVCISYAGPLGDLEKLPGYRGVVDACRTHKTELLVSPMSMTGAVNVGEGAVTVGFAAEPHETNF